MPETQDATTLRARLEHHEAAKASAEAERARLIADRSERGAFLSDSDLDETETEIDRLADVIEKATSRLALIRPALDRAVEAEADAERRKRTAGGSEQDAGVVSGIQATFGANAAAEAAVALRAASIPVRPVSQSILDAPPAPRAVYADPEAWHRERDKRLRDKRAARAASSSAPRSAPNYSGFSSERN